VYTDFNILELSRGSVVAAVHAPGSRFTCFAGTKVQIPVPEACFSREGSSRTSEAVTASTFRLYTAFVYTKVQMLTPQELLFQREAAEEMH
jgi:hypothetical protein